MISKDALNELNDVVNNTWGKSSGDGTMSLTCSMEHDKMLVKFQTVVHFASEQSLRQQVDRLVAESNDLINKKVAQVKKAFKETSGTSVKFSEIDSRDDVELISTSVHNPRKIAIYRRQCSLRVE
tara:strand:- start:375 stop:749 length:375 start_codon:yes stop_codon:yes gene_type:complete